MRNVLFITSSLSGAASASREVGQGLVNSLLAANPGATIVERELTPATMPHLEMATLAALGVPAEQRDEGQAARVAFADRLIEELEQADTIVIAAPMYNFSVPSTVKAWIDHVARAGRTFRYTAEGPQGLLTGKKVYLALSRGGIYTQGPASAFDHQESYLRAVLSFVGLTEVTVVHAEGLNISPEANAAGRQKAKETVATLFPVAIAA
jgi:FMN-dependent NADH-azoreductase